MSGWESQHCVTICLCTFVVTEEINLHSAEQYMRKTCFHGGLFVTQAGYCSDIGQQQLLWVRVKFKGEGVKVYTRCSLICTYIQYAGLLPHRSCVSLKHWLCISARITARHLQDAIYETHGITVHSSPPFRLPASHAYTLIDISDTMFCNSTRGGRDRQLSHIIFLSDLNSEKYNI